MSDRFDHPRAASSEDSLIYQALGRAVQVLRTERGLGRRHLAKLAGVSYPYLSQIETGKKRPSSSTLVAIAEALRIQLSELLGTAETLAERMAEAPFEVTGRPGGAGKPLPSLRKRQAAAEWMSQAEEAAEPSVAAPSLGREPAEPSAAEAGAAGLGPRAILAGSSPPSEGQAMRPMASPRRRGRWFSAGGVREGSPGARRAASRQDAGESAGTPSAREMRDDLLEAASRLSDRDLRTLLDLARRLTR
jgi:transcriptional regulator with XRE-family HTH domain